MKAIPRVLYLFVFIGLAVVAALTLDKILEPSASAVLVRAAVVAALCGAPGLIHRKLWPVSIVLLPIGAYLLMRTIIPLPDTVHGIGEQYRFYSEQFHVAGAAYKYQFFPLDLNESPELRLLFGFSAYCATGAAAFLALSLRRAIPGAIILLVVLGFGLTVDGSARTLVPALLFLVLAGSLLVLSRSLNRQGWRLRDAFIGTAAGVVAALLAFVLLVAAPSVVATPWQNWRSWDFFNRGQSVFTFNWLQNYPSLLDPGGNAEVMKVASPLPSYWKASSLDIFTGSAWVTSRPFLQRIDGQQQDGSDGQASFKYDIPASGPVPSGKTVTETFEITGANTNYFFVGGDPVSLLLDQQVALRTSDVRALRVATQLKAPIAYSVTAVIPQLHPADFVGLGRDYPAGLASYLTLPFPRLNDLNGPDKKASFENAIGDSGPNGAEWAGLYDVNQQIVGDASDPYDVTLRVERYLRQSYTYSLSPPVSQFSSPYAAFLFDTRTGYCQHFAGAMALILRFNGIPARVAVGFATGEAESPGIYTVTRNNAHAWVEVYFPGEGWVAFDPTPGRSVPVAGASSTSPGFINPFTEASPANPTGVSTPTTIDDTPGGAGIGTPGQTTDGPGWLSQAHWLPWVLGALVVLAGWPSVRLLWLRRRIRRGTPDQRLQASLRLMRSHLSDYGVPVAPSHTLEDVLQTLQTKIGLEPDQAFVDRAEAVLFGGRHARSDDIRRAEALRREVQARLRRQQGWVRTGIAWYGLQALLRRPIPTA